MKTGGRFISSPIWRGFYPTIEGRTLESPRSRGPSFHGGDGGDEDDTGVDLTPGCGGELEECCDGATCDAGFDAVNTYDSVTYDPICQCQRPCTFSTCDAGSESGHCMSALVTDAIACYNTTDFQPSLTTNCDVGETDCKSASGATKGTTCVGLLDFDGSSVPRCIVTCTQPPKGCDGFLTTCFPAYIIDGTSMTADFDNGHCVEER